MRLEQNLLIPRGTVTVHKETKKICATCEKTVFRRKMGVEVMTSALFFAKIR